MVALLRSGRDPLFRHVPPCATDIDFMPSWDAPTRPSRLPVVCAPSERLVYEPDPEPLDLEAIEDVAADAESGVAPDDNAIVPSTPGAVDVDYQRVNEGKRKTAELIVADNDATSSDVAEPPLKKKRSSTSS